jgi:hypothetical protein
VGCGRVRYLLDTSVWLRGYYEPDTIPEEPRRVGEGAIRHGDGGKYEREYEASRRLMVVSSSTRGRERPAYNVNRPLTDSR